MLYESVRDEQVLKRHFQLGVIPEEGKLYIWPTYSSLFIRRHEFADVGDETVPKHETFLGSFGLIPHWATDTKIARQTYNARSETVSIRIITSNCRR